MPINCFPIIVLLKAFSLHSSQNHLEGNMIVNQQFEWDGEIWMMSFSASLYYKQKRKCTLLSSQDSV